ncbi:hypothetical protein DRW41_04625 [Neobacillus piezotolerans]|uniref:Uncharacterized protein n=1 Tax=Neobacillus piezotolerans TaxID=2259171 RepID=A0A3D8GWL1_9BACI|nr:hypothetical protein [Neobacillus piezotolerans]RDU38847.1 hypothetical protein DRW41_04625 [Neobacillus piezotolerans]
MVTLHRYFIGSSLSFMAFVLSVPLLDFVLSMLYLSSGYRVFSLSVLSVYSIPFVYGTTLATVLTYLLLKKYIPRWNYITHCLLAGILFSMLFGLGLFEESLTGLLTFPGTYGIMIGAVIFSLGKYIPLKKSAVFAYFIPLFAAAGSIIYVNLSF